MMRPIVFGLVAAIAAANLAEARETPTAYVESDGEATITVAPNRVSFWLHFEVSENSVADAMAVANGFDNRLNLALQEYNLPPLEIEYTPPSITSLQHHRVYMGARLVFPMGNFVNPDQGPRLFAELCDKLLEIAENLGADVTGPIFEVNDRESVVRRAVAAATEQAYPVAQAVAGSLESAVWSVDTVRILDVTWNRPLFSPNPEPNLRQISCTARVRITYSLLEN